MKFKRPVRHLTGIDMTPVIDVVFQLLIFFMITSAYMKTAAINVDLPSAKTSDNLPVKQAVITLYKSGAITINDKTNAIEKIGDEVKTLYTKNNELIVTIRGDKGVPLGTLVEVMDIVRQSGVSRLSIATKLKEDR